MADEWTIGRLLGWTTGYLQEHGSENPRLEAEVLLAHARSCRRIELYTTFGELADEKLRSEFRDLVRRRAEGVPVAYLVGHREFFSLDFRVNSDVLIPRPETEFLVLSALDQLKARDNAQPASVADVGTGSGNIAISLARQAPQVRVTALDISRAAIGVATDNAIRLGVSDRLEFIVSDLLAGVGERCFDLIVSNPPYISRAEMAELPRDVRAYEPELALFGGETGIEVIERLATQAAKQLSPGGSLLFEISPMLQQPVERLLAQAGAWSDSRIIKDLAGLARVVHARRL
jgi:release factor glutamine methyltransferase